MKVMNKVGDRVKFTWIERKVELSEDQAMALKKIDGVYLEKNVEALLPQRFTFIASSWLCGRR